MKMNKYEKCQGCNGEGKYFVYFVGYCKCRLCYGTGKVKSTGWPQIVPLFW